MLFMVIERFKNRDAAAAVYRRFEERGRMLPEGLRYLSSWIAADLGRCFQLMDCDDPRLFEQWIANWRDLVDFEIVPVVSTKEAGDAFA
ncbi:MAG: hypothetical protein QOE33_1226 [Acidobacteriota bacterium]|nr:hypothetical protein [Acidobacteriota bacterium]